MKIKNLKFIEESNVMVVYEMTYLNFWGKEKTMSVVVDKHNDIMAKNLK